MRANKPILLVEDDRVDAMTVKRAFKDIDVRNDILLAQNGEEALRILGDQNPSLPCIILLDLNMPKMNGIEFLNIIKQHEEYKVIPVIVLTTSRADQDRYESFKHSAAGYMIKPVEYKDFVNTMKIIKEYWTTSELA